MEIVLIRHAQSANNKLWEETGGVVGRSPDPRLTPLGEQQAGALAGWLADHEEAPRLTALHTSYMWRAVQTAAPVAAALGLTLHGHGEIFEVGGPYLEGAEGESERAHPGASLAELSTITPGLVADGVPLDGGWWPGPFEVWELAPGRAARVLAWLRASYGEEDVVGLVTHGLFSQYLVRALLGISEMTGWIHLDNTGVSRFVVEGEAVVATVLNGVDHLTRAQRSS